MNFIAEMQILKRKNAQLQTKNDKQAKEITRLYKMGEENAILRGEIERLKEYEWKYKDLCK